jgi:hypothetical protein
MPDKLPNVAKTCSCIQSVFVFDFWGFFFCSVTEAAHRVQKWDHDKQSPIGCQTQLQDTHTMMGPCDEARTLWTSQRSEHTTPEEEGSERQDSKSWDGAGKKERDRCVSTLVTLSRHRIVADIARATPAAETSEECAVEELSGGWRKPTLS